MDGPFLGVNNGGDDPNTPNLDEADFEKTDPDEAGPIPAHKTAGDGLVVRDEYRGFVGTYHTDPNQHRRLSAVEKELLVEIDIMDQITDKSDQGESEEFDDIGRRLTDNDKNWDLGEFDCFKLNPNTVQNVTFPILTMLDDWIDIIEGANMREVAQAGDPYEIKPHKLPADADVTTAMGKVQDVYRDDLGITVYYIVDDKPPDDPENPRVKWDKLNGDFPRFRWVEKCRDNGEEGEDHYELFVHLGLVDIFWDTPTSVGGSSSEDIGALVALWVARQHDIAVKSRGSQFVNHLALVIAHELGHCIRINDERDKTEVAFRMRHTRGQGVTATFLVTSPFGCLPPDLAKTQIDEETLKQHDLRSQQYDEMQKLVNVINDDPDYEAQLVGSAKQHPMSIIHVINDITHQYRDILNHEDDFIMDARIFWDHASGNLKFDPEHVVHKIDLPNRFRP